MEEQERQNTSSRDVRISIASLLQACIQGFGSILNTAPSNHPDYADSSVDLNEELGRLRLWAGNHGAHRKHTDRLSLDHRLREAPDIHKLVAEHLSDILNSIRGVQAVLDSEDNGLHIQNSLYQPPESDSSSSDEGSVDDVKGYVEHSEVAESLEDIRHAITSLYKFSATLLRSARKDVSKKAARVDLRYKEPYDIKHVSDKFGLPLNDVLVQRLGKANTRRRQLLAYHKQHGDKIARYIDVFIDNSIPPSERPRSERVGTSTVSPQITTSVDNRDSAPSALSTEWTQDTTVSTVHMVEYEAASETDRTIFSQASSRADDLDTQLVIPPPPIPEVDVGLTPFICPYCCQTVTVKNIHDDWAYHVYSDLRPYICTFGGCQDADRLYDSYTEWSEHESQFHRCEWACSLCSHISDTESSFSVHLEASHLKELSRDQLHTVLKISRRPTNASQQCPLCNKLPITDPKKFQKHLARHLRQLCLDVLPMDESIARTDPDHPEGSASSERTSDFDGIVGSPSETALLTFRNKLRINIVPFSMAEGRGFVPISIIKELVHGNAQNILREQNIVNSEQLPSVAETIEKHAPKLFTLLVNLEKESDIVRFLAEGITDQSLPVRDGAQGGLELFTKQGRPMQTIKQWDDWVVKAFITMQYQVLSPVFQRGRHYVLDEEQVLPFVDQDFESNYRPPTTEDYTEVRRAHIHQHHYEFGYSTRRGKALAVVLKGRPQVAGVNREMRILRDLSSSVHPNLIDLLFTYEKNDLSYVVIPSADANLREYWIMNSNSELSGVLLGWSIGQMAGLADALALFHKFHSATLNVTRYGRHGDIKAENILWFRDSHLLKIAGLQLSNDKGRKMKDSINPDEVIAPPTYSPPDRHRELLISRKWDIWSLGCLYLEFITFLVLGNDAIVEFSNERLDTSGEDPALRTDDFYTSNWQDVKPSVFSWINRLRENSRCTNALCDVLTLIMAKMIVIEPEERASAAQVHSELRTIHDRATSSSYYLLDSGSEPEGRPIRGKTSSFLNVSSIQSRRDEPGRRRNNFARAFRNFLRI